MLLVLASGIDSQPCPNTFSIFAMRWSTERMPNSAMSLLFSLRTATFPTPPRRLFNCQTAGPKGSVGRRFRHPLCLDDKANLSSSKGFAIARAYADSCESVACV